MQPNQSDAIQIRLLCVALIRTPMNAWRQGAKKVHTHKDSR